MKITQKAENDLKRKQKNCKLKNKLNRRNINQCHQ